MRKLSTVTSFAVLLALAAPALQAQVTVRRPTSDRAGGGGGADNKVPVTVALTVGGKPYRASGQGTCQYAPRASMYDMAASLWSVQLPQTSMSVWRPLKGGPMQLSLSVREGRSSHEISTVYKSKAVGSGTVSFQPRGAGGRFDISGKSGDGATVRGTIECARMTGLVAEGG